MRNILIAREIDKAESVLDLIENSIKQALCFDTLKAQRGNAEMRQKDIAELHAKAEFLAQQIEHKDLGYDNKYEFDK